MSQREPSSTKEVNDAEMTLNPTAPSMNDVMNHQYEQIQHCKFATTLG